MLRIATFNLENLFTRPTAMSGDSDAVGRPAIEHHAELNAIACKAQYSDDDKARLVELSNYYGFHLLNAPADALVRLQKIRGRLFYKPEDGPLEVVADGRDDWTGWFELRRHDVSWEATYNTGRVIAETNPHVLVTVEVENRPTLERFNEHVLKACFGRPYPHLMVIDGNDDRGIDVGILSDFPLREIRSHVDDLDAGGRRLFSRDCAEFDILLPDGTRLAVLANHLKSKRSGNDQASRNRRLEQATRAHQIAMQTLADRTAFVVVAGDLNDTPPGLVATPTALQPLFCDGFKDVISHPRYPTDRPGTYETGLPHHKIDYLILSPEMFGLLRDTGIERRGSYHPNTWTPFDTVTNRVTEASDHHLLWADFEISV